MSEPPTPNRWAWLKQPRLWNIAFRTAHIGAAAVLFGGHVLEADEGRLAPWLYGSVATGVVLIALEAYPSWGWLHEGRGVLVLLKLLVLGAIPWCWSWRAYLLAAVLILASVGSHMPKRFRHYSLAHRQVIPRS